MKIIVFGIAMFCVFCVMFGGMAYAVYDKPCSVNIHNINNISPTFYDGNMRNNPNGSVYPGDAIHFLFKYSGTDTCTSFSLKPLVGSENLTFESALVISDNNPHPKSHAIILYKWTPKYLKTFHYYEVLGHDVRGCYIGAGSNCKNTSTPILAESPIISIREDVPPTKQQSKLTRPDSTCYFCKPLHRIVTQSWHLVQDEIQYSIGVDEHVLEDRNSVDKFISIVKSNCSDLSKHSGCVFGHIEINTDVDNSKQICLFEELDKLGINYDESIETDQCISKDSEDKISISVRGTGLDCDGDKCKSYTKTDTDSISPNILSPYGDILFKYLQLYDSDGFYFRNNDGTYYLDDVIGIHSIPDAPFKENRAGTLTFDNVITQNTINEIYHTSCDDYSCDVKLSDSMISPSTHHTTNGDMISTHYSYDMLGLASIHHESEMYNLNRYIGLYQSIATPLVVCYDPIISKIQFWSYLADAGNSSFDNRYSAAIKYDGSVGGCADDPAGLYPDRRVKITDIYSVFVQSDNFGKIINVTNPDVFLSDGSSIADMSILDSVRNMITNHTLADSFAGPTLSMNHTIQDVQIDSAGFSQLLLDVSINDSYLEKNFINVTSYNTFGSTNFGGKDAVYLAYGTYEYPWGFFSTPFNVTAYKYVSENIPCEKEFCDDAISVALVDEDVVIGMVNFADSTNTLISLVDFYLNYHKDDDEEFAYMHLSDLYEMNVPQNIQSHTGEFLLNKTAIYYDGAMQDYLFENYLYGNDTSLDSPVQYLINQSPRVFPEGPYYVSAEISATRNDKQKTNTIPFDGLYMKHPLEYSVNMHTDNYLDIKRATTAVSIPYYLHFGKITNVTINDAPAKNISCNDGCMIILPNENPIDITAQNQWGGKITNHNLTAIELVPYDESLWTELLPERVFWILFVLGILYVSYRALKTMISF